MGSAPGLLKAAGRMRSRRRVSAIREDAVEEDEQEEGGFKVLARARTKKKAGSDDDGETAEAEETSGKKCVLADTRQLVVSSFLPTPHLAKTDGGVVVMARVFLFCRKTLAERRKERRKQRREKLQGGGDDETSSRRRERREKLRQRRAQDAETVETPGHEGETAAPSVSAGPGNRSRRQVHTLLLCALTTCNHHSFVSPSIHR